MRYALTDIPSLFATPAGRMHLRRGISYRLWPLTSRLARLYRRTIARRVCVVAVVGSFGKSTTTRLVAAVLQAPAHDEVPSNAWGSIARAVLWIGPAQPHAVIEVGIAAPGQMAQYARTVRPDITVVTSVGSEHHRSLGTLEVTRDEKAWMLRALPRTGVAVLNGDDPNVIWMRQHTAARIVTFGFDAACDVRAGGFQLDWPHGSRFDLSAFGVERQGVRLRLLGRQMVRAALAAIAVGHSAGLALDDTLERLQAVPPTPGRMEPVALDNGVIVLRDDFKSALETMHAALDAFALIPARRRIVLFGDITEPRAPVREGYRALGARVAGMATHFVVVSPLLAAYASGARRAGMPKSAIIDGGRTPRQVATALAALLEPGDVVLIKGRGSQKLDRVRLILQGRRVNCDIVHCNLNTVNCERCPMLERGWVEPPAFMK